MKQFDQLRKDGAFYKQASTIYFVYFFFFLSSGPLESMLSYYYFQEYSAKEWGIFLSLLNLLSVLLPTFISWLCLNRNAYRIASVGIVISAIGGILIGYFGNVSIWLLLLLSIIAYSGRTVFNHSYGNYINYTIDSSKLNQFLAVRDVFLFSGISLGSMLGGVLVKYFSYRIAFVVVSLLFGIVLLFLNHNNQTSVHVPSEDEEKSKKENIFHYWKKFLRNKSVLVITIVYLAGAIYGSAYDFVGEIGLSIGFDVSTLLSFSGIIVFVNALVAFMISTIFVVHNRKWLFVLDITIDAIPALLFAFASHRTVFLLGMWISMVKDILMPFTFAYIISRFDDQEGMVALGFLGSLSSLLNIAFPSLFGFLWKSHARNIFLIGAIACLIAGLVSALALDSEKLTKDAVKAD